MAILEQMPRYANVLVIIAARGAQRNERGQRERLECLHVETETTFVQRFNGPPQRGKALMQSVRDSGMMDTIRTDRREVLPTLEGENCDFDVNVCLHIY